MIKEVLLVLSLASGLTLSVSESLPGSLLPHTPESFNISYIQVLLASHHEPNWKIRNRLVIFLSIVLLMHNVKGKTFLLFCFWNSWRTRGVVLTWWLYLLVVRLLGIPGIRSVLLLGMLMATRFCLFLHSMASIYLLFFKWKSLLQVL